MWALILDEIRWNKIRSSENGAVDAGFMDVVLSQTGHIDLPGPGDVKVTLEMRFCSDKAYGIKHSLDGEKNKSTKIQNFSQSSDLATVADFSTHNPFHRASHV